jgi:hypothetical protein
MYIRKGPNFMAHNFEHPKNKFKADELEFELGHETRKKSADPVLRFGRYQGQRLSETPLDYRIWLKSQPWWKG